MIQLLKPKIFPVQSFTGKSLLISGLDPPPLPLACHVSGAPCRPGFLGLQGTKILHAMKPSSPVVGTGWVGSGCELWMFGCALYLPGTMSAPSDTVW